VAGFLVNAGKRFENASQLWLDMPLLEVAPRAVEQANRLVKITLLTENIAKLVRDEGLPERVAHRPRVGETLLDLFARLRMAVHDFGHREGGADAIAQVFEPGELGQR
jgi:hypothetical protein